MIKAIKLFLRFTIAAAFVNAVGGRLGFWSKEVTMAEGWQSFLEFTQLLNPWMPDSMVPVVGLIVTIAEVSFAVLLITGFKTELAARLSGLLILSFGLAMMFSLGFKSAIDNSVLVISAAAFGLSTIKEKFMELDTLLNQPKQ